MSLEDKLPEDFNPNWPEIIRNMLFREKISVFETRGNLVLPFKVLSEPGRIYRRNKTLNVDWAKRRYFELHPDIKEVSELLVKQEVGDTAERGLVHTAADKEYRLSDYKLSPQGRNLKLFWSETDIHRFFATNLSLDKKCLDGKSIREVFHPTFLSLRDLPNSVLSNRLGMNILVYIEDGKVAAISQRTEQVTHDRGKYEVTACGHVDYNDVNENGIPDPFVAAARIVDEKLGINKKNGFNIKPDDIDCLGFGVDYYLGLTHGFFDITLQDVTLNDLLKLQKNVKDPLEIGSIKKADFSSRDNFVKIFNYEMPGWEVECLMHCILSAEIRFGLGEWWKDVKIPKKYKDDWLNCRPSFYNISNF